MPQPTSRTRRLLFWFVIALILALGIWHWVSPSRKEPSYHGKSLTKWLRQLDDGEVSGISSSFIVPPTPAQIEAADAIRTIGTNALPFLMQDIHSRPNPNSFRYHFPDLINNFARQHFGSPIIDLGPSEADRIRWRAAQGLAVLGPLAKPALPELQRLLLTNFWHSSIKESAYALSTIGPEGITALTNAVTPRTEWSGMCAIWALGQHPAVGTNYIPFLIDCTASPSQGIASGSLEALGLFRADPQHVIPALTRALSRNTNSVAYSAAWALGQFGNQATSAVPLIQPLTNDPVMRTIALEALRKIQSPAPHPNTTEKSRRDDGD